jgi:hypothetical protein
MKNKSLTILFLFIYSGFCFSQEKTGYLTNFYFADTIVEVNQMKIEYKLPMAYGDKFKVQTYITNLTDSFKILAPADIEFTSGGKTVRANGTRLLVIPPKCTKKFRLLAEGANFKNTEVKTSLNNVQTTSKIENIYSPKEIILDKAALRSIEQALFPTSTVGPLQIKLKKFTYKPNGVLSVRLIVSYTGEDFLGIHVKKIKLISSEGKTYINQNQTTGSLYYKKEKKEMGLTLEFENPYGLSKDFKSDKLVFDDVFAGYAIDKNSDKKEFTFTKNGEGLGNAPKDEKEKDIEVIED